MAHIYTPIPKLKLNDGNSIPMLGYGTGTAWFKSGDESKHDQALVDAIKTAIKLEYIHLDGAELYKTEGELGQAIKEGGVPRENLFVTTKAMSWSAGKLEEALRTSLKKLQLDYVDLYLIHFPYFVKDDPKGWTEEALQKEWAVMEKLKADGLTKSIGVSNYRPEHLDAVLKTAKIKPAINQIEFHPYYQHRVLLDYHKRNNIATEAYGPLTAITKGAPGPIDSYVESLAKKYAVNPAEILLRWTIDQDVVAVTTSSKEQRLSDYLRIGTFKLTPKEIQELAELGDQKHFRAFKSDREDPEDRT